MLDEFEKFQIVNVFDVGCCHLPESVSGPCGCQRYREIHTPKSKTHTQPELYNRNLNTGVPWIFDSRSHGLTQVIGAAAESLNSGLTPNTQTTTQSTINTPKSNHCMQRTHSHMDTHSPIRVLPCLHCRSEKGKP